MKRKCNKCPETTKIVCRHAFGVFWCIKSLDGEGCNYPMDKVSETWRNTGWLSGNTKPVPVAIAPTGAERRRQSQIIQDELPSCSVRGDSSPRTLQPLSDDDY